mgnify:CR=1 FL=1
MQPIAEGFGLIEGPIWVAGKGLLFSDVQSGGVFCLDENHHVEELFPHRKGIGGMAEHVADGVGVTVDQSGDDHCAGKVVNAGLATDELFRVRAISSSRMPCSTKPKPAPPYASGMEMAGRASSPLICC